MFIIYHFRGTQGGITRFTGGDYWDRRRARPGVKRWSSTQATNNHCSMARGMLHQSKSSGHNSKGKGRSMQLTLWM